MLQCSRIPLIRKLVIGIAN